jgi:hypothetical protein
MSLLNRIITEILNPLIGLMFAVAIAVFIWGIVEFIWNADNEQKRDQGKRHIAWGLFGLLIMATVAGIIEIIRAFVRF